MQIIRTGVWQIDIKTKQVAVEISSTVKIGEVVIDGPGEYDVAGVAVQGLAADKQTVFVIGIEDLTICAVPTTPEKLSQIMLEQIGSIDLAIVPVAKGMPSQETIALINSLDPSVVVPIGDGETDELVKVSNEPTDSSGSPKITKASLPTEGRVTYFLKP